MDLTTQHGRDTAAALNDVIVEYRSTYLQLGLSSDQFWSALEPLVRDPARDPDRLADALKEFVVRSMDRGNIDTPLDLLEDLDYVRQRIVRRTKDGLTVAQRCFGVAAEDLDVERCVRLAENIIRIAGWKRR
jgi:hypothetical protein